MSLIPDAAVVVDVDGRIVSVNERAEDLFGYQRGSLSGISIESLVPERARHRHRQHRTSFFEAPLNRPMGAGLELTGRCQDGSEFPLDISLAPIVNDGERLVVAAIRDVTEQRRATAAQAELATIVRSSFDAIISMTLDGRITNWNPAAEDLFGYRRADIIGQHVAILVPDHASGVLEELLDAASASGHRGATDTKWLHCDGQDVDVAISISPLRDLSGTLRGYAAMARDISERKTAEIDLHRLLAEGEQLQRQQAATSEIRLALLSGASLTESLTLICLRAADLLECPVAVISLQEGDAVRIVAAVGTASGMIGTILPASGSFAEQVIVRQEPLEIARRSAGSQVDVPATLPDGPTFGVPILIGGVATGALTFVRQDDGGPFGPTIRLFGEALAAQASLAFEFDRTRRHREEMALAGDRDRIARDLHDHVIQRLFGAGMGLQGSLPLIADSRAHQRVSDAIEQVDQTIREVRNTIFSLSIPAGAAQRLRAQVLEAIEEAGVGLGFQPSVTFDGPIDSAVPDTVVPHVLACVREALSNVSRHAQASAVDLQIVVTGDLLIVSVTDNGVGVGSPRRSSGLANLEERARILGGAFEVWSPSAGGTHLKWTARIRQE